MGIARACHIVAVDKFVLTGINPAETVCIGKFFFVEIFINTEVAVSVIELCDRSLKIFTYSRCVSVIIKHILLNR